MFKSILVVLLFSSGSLACGPHPEERPIIFVIFGATGDLAARKILPALSNLAREEALPAKFAVVGVGRRDYTHEDFRKHFQGTDADFQKKIFYSKVPFEEPFSYDNLKGLLLKIDQDFGVKSNRIFFLATQVSFFAPIVEQLGVHGMIADPVHGQEWTRVMIEKPFGHDLESAIALQSSIEQTLAESQIYRIDHYLAKEGVQNLILFRSKGDFEPCWNNRYIDHVQITMSEEIGIGSRANFWEETGLLRDVVQNHLLQVLSLLGSDLPDQNISKKKTKLLQEIRPIHLNDIVRGQYGPQSGILGYKQELGVPTTSNVETFAAAKLWIDNERWEGVPFYFRAGKRLPVQLVEAAVFFKQDPYPLVFRIQPNPKVFWHEREIALSGNTMHEAYETLLLDCMNGDRNRFVEKEEQYAAWRLLTPILHDWHSHAPLKPFPNYPAGTWGPEEALRLLSEDGREWRDPIF